MISNKQLAWQMIGIQTAGSFLSIILLFAYRMVTASDSPIQWVCYVGGAFVTLAYLSLIYGWMWQRGNKDMSRERRDPNCYGEHRAIIGPAAMMIPNLAIILLYIYTLMEKFAGNTNGLTAIAEVLRVFWYSPFFEWMYPLATGPNNTALFPLLILFAFPAPIFALIGYKLGYADISFKGFILKLLPEKDKEEFPEQSKKIAKDILTEENYRNIYRKKPPKA